MKTNMFLRSTLLGIFLVFLGISHSSSLASTDSYQNESTAFKNTENIKVPHKEKIYIGMNAPSALPELSINDISVPEGQSGTTNADFTVTLSDTITQTVTVDYTTADGTATAPSDYTSTSDTLTFDPGGSTTQTITVLVNGDATFESDETFTVDLTNPSNATIADDQGVGTIQNDDGQPSISINDVSLNEGNSGTTNFVFDVSLSNPSSQTITVDYTTADGTATAPSDYTSTSDTLTFDPGGSTTQTITVLVNGDATFESDETFTVDLTNPSNATIADDQGVGTIQNDDGQPSVSFTSASQSAGENAGTILVGVQLSNPTVSTVTIPFTLTGTATQGAAFDYTISPTNTVTIPANSTTADITITVIDDSIDESDETVVITMGIPTNATLGTPSVHTATITDNDTAGITVDPTSGLTTTEAGGTDTFTIVLISQPTADVTIGLSSSDTTEGSVSPTSVTFTNLNWDSPQTITVTGVDDNIADGSIPYSIDTTVASSADPIYNEMLVDNVSVLNIDNDAADITVNPTSGLLTTEGGGTDAFTVVLNSQPLSNVTINLSSSDITEGTISTGSVIFTPVNWSIPITVTVTGVNDNLADGNIDYTIVTAPATSGDTNYNGVNPDDVSVTNQDDDTAGITVNPTSGLLTTESGGTADFTVVLNTQPTADVTIGLSSSDTSEGLITKASLTFTSLSWNVAQIVTVIGVDDDINDHDVSFKVITAQAGSNDPDYKNLDVPDVSVTNLDNDGCEIEWVSPIETKGFYKIGIDEEEITLEVRAVDKDCTITRVRFYRWDAVNEVHVQIGEVSTEPFRIILNIDPLNYDYNQIFAVAYDEDDDTSEHPWIFLQRFVFYFLPSVFR